MAVTLNFGGYLEQVVLYDDLALLIEDVRFDHHIQQAGLIFQGHEHDTLSCAWSLAVGDHAGHSNSSSPREILYAHGCRKSFSFEARSDHTDRVVSQAQSLHFVVFTHVFCRARLRECDRVWSLEPPEQGQVIQSLN